MKRKALLGFDLGTKTGFCALAPEGEILESSVWDMTPKKDEDYGKRFKTFRECLDIVLNEYDTVGVAYEEVVFFRAAYAAQVYGGLLAVFTSTCYEKGVLYSSVKVTELKKFATGSGAAKKPEMLRALVSKHPDIAEYASIDDNSVDAAWLALYLKEYGE